MNREALIVTLSMSQTKNIIVWLVLSLSLSTFGIFTNNGTCKVVGTYLVIFGFLLLGCLFLFARKVIQDAIEKGE